MIRKETIEQIIDSARIEEVVGDFVTLKRRGANLIGLCPFHNEKTPSFTVSPAKGIYKCFGCGAAGNSVNFIMEHEHTSYPDALRYLAQKYNIQIEEEAASPQEIQREGERESLFAVCSFAQQHFTHNLRETDEGKSVGLSYFLERGFTLPTIEKFQLGYALDAFDDLLKAAQEKGYALELLEKTGLLKKKEEGRWFDFFRSRVTFPIHNVTGKVIGFGARTLRSDKKEPKYLNSPETEIYNKSKVLYGIFQAKRSIIKENNCYLVEGYTDVISLHQSGIENVVASSGTSLTTEQIRLIKRYTPNITILYDGDAAGIKASFRGIDMILEEGMNVKVLLFPDGEDPDSYSRKLPQEEFHQFLKNNTKDFILFKSEILLKDAQNDPVKKAGLLKELVQSVALIPDGITRSVYIRECSRIFQMEEQVLLSELNKLLRKKVSDRSKSHFDDTPLPTEEIQSVPIEKEEPVVPDEIYPQEKDIIRILLNYGNKEVNFQITNEEGHPEIISVFVAQFIVKTIREDGLKLLHTPFEIILSDFEQELENDQLPTEAHFTHHDDDLVQKAAIDVLTHPYELSEQWEKKHRIFTTHEDARLSVVVRNAVYSYKLKRIMKMIQDLQQELQHIQEEQQMMKVMEEMRDLHEIKKIISAELGRVILK